MAAGSGYDRLCEGPSKGGEAPTYTTRIISARLLAALAAVGLLTLLTLSSLNNSSEDSVACFLGPQSPLTSALQASIHTLQTSTVAALSRLETLQGVLFTARWQRSILEAADSSSTEDALVALSRNFDGHVAREGSRLVFEKASERRTAPLSRALLSSEVAPKRRILRTFANFSTGISSLYTHHVVSELLSGADGEPGMPFPTAAAAAPTAAPCTALLLAAQSAAQAPLVTGVVLQLRTDCSSEWPWCQIPFAGTFTAGCRNELQRQNSRVQA